MLVTVVFTYEREFFVWRKKVCVTGRGSFVSTRVVPGAIAVSPQSEFSRAIQIEQTSYEWKRNF